MTDETSVGLQKGFSEWWNEETEYLFQRIERWAAFARGYNRLRSERLSRGRMTMREEQETRWTISSNKIVIEDPNWSPRFNNLKRSHRRKNRNDENCKIDCCGTFDYRSNGNLDSTCLENYRYDHSIYFKTIGDIKSSKKDTTNDKTETDDVARFDEQSFFELKVKTAREFVDDRNFHDDDDRDDEVDDGNENFHLRVPKFELDIRDVDDDDDDVLHNVVHNAWPIVDITKLSLDASTDNNRAVGHCDYERKTRDDFIVDEDRIDTDDNNFNDNDNNNNNANSYDRSDRNENGADSAFGPLKNNHEGFTRVSSFRKQRRSPRKVKQPKLVGDNNVMWPGVLLNYTRNVDPTTSPHNHHTIHVK